MRRPSTSSFASKKPITINLAALGAHIALALATAGAGYYLGEQQQSTANTAQLATATQQAKSLIERYAANWQEQGTLVAQHPDLKFSGRIRATTTLLDGGTPTTLSFIDQDLVNRTQKAPTGPEIRGNGQNATVAMARTVPAGGMIIMEWPLAPLISDLDKITPASVQLFLSQSINGQSMEVYTLHGKPARNTPEPLAVPGWQLQTDLSQKGNLPLMMALLGFFAGLLPLAPWLLIKSKALPAERQPPAQIDPATIVDLHGGAAPQKPAAASTSVPAPAGNQSDAGSLQSVVDSLPLEPVVPKPILSKDETPTTPASAGLDDVLADVAAPAPAPAVAEKSNVMEFTLDNSLLPDLVLGGNPAPSGPPAEIFRAYDIRGHIDSLTPDLVSQIGRALGTILKEKYQHQVVVGYDARLTSPSYAKRIREALVQCGLTVIDIGLVPTPLMHFAARQHDGNGIMVTASHNPGTDNGIKWVMETHPPLPEEIQGVRDRVIKAEFAEGSGQERQENYLDSYIEFLMGDIMLSEGQSVTFDGLNGAMGPVALTAFNAFGMQVSSLNANPDGNFPLGNPDPAEPGRLEDLANDIIISGGSVGLAFDGDGDRLVVMDSTGKVVSPDHLMILLSRMVLESSPGADILFDVKTSRIVANAITQNGGRPVMLRSGNTFIREALQSTRYEAAFGGEISGHYFFKDGRGYGDNDDALYTALRLLEWLEQTGQTLDEAVADLPQRVSTSEYYLPLEAGAAQRLIQQITPSAETLADATVSTLDGLRIDFMDGFGIIRPSNTSANMTLRFDASNEEALSRIKQQFRDLVAPHAPEFASLMPV